MATVLSEYVSFNGEWVPVPSGGAAPISTNSPNHLDMDTNLLDMFDWDSFNQAGTTQGPLRMGYDPDAGYYTQHPTTGMVQNMGVESPISSTAPFSDTLNVQVEVEVCLILKASPSNGLLGDMGLAITVLDPTPITGVIVHDQTLLVTPSPAGENGTWNTVLFGPFSMVLLVADLARTELRIKTNSGVGDAMNVANLRLRKCRWLDAATGALIETVA